MTLQGDEFLMTFEFRCCPGITISLSYLRVVLDIIRIPYPNFLAQAESLIRGPYEFKLYSTPDGISTDFWHQLVMEDNQFEVPGQSTESG
jgi:hypothetical protein